MLTANVRERSDIGNARDYVWALCEWMGPSRKDPDRLDPHRCIEPDSGNVRATGWLEGAPFQQHGGQESASVARVTNLSAVVGWLGQAMLGSRGAAGSPKHRYILSYPLSHLKPASPCDSLLISS